MTEFLGVHIDAPYSNYLMSLKVKKIMDQTISTSDKAGIKVNRFILNAFNCPTTLGSKIMTVALRMSELEWIADCIAESEWVKSTTRSPTAPNGRLVSFYHQITDPTEIIYTMTDTFRHVHLHSLVQADVSQQYENLPHDGDNGIISCCLEEFSTARRRRKASCLHIRLLDKHGAPIKNLQGRWLTKHKPGLHDFCVNDKTLIDLLQLLLYWNVVKFGDSYFWQKLGIPMRFNMSPLISQIYFNVPDRKETRRLVYAARHALPDLQPAAWAKAEATSFLFRKMDDVTWFNNPDALQDLVNRLALDQDGKPYLCYKDETTSRCPTTGLGMTGNMCDARFNITDGQLRFTLYDKSEDMGALAEELIRYSKGSSCSPPTILRSVLTGQLSRIYGVSETLAAFIINALKVLIRLHANGFVRSSIITEVKKVCIPKLPYISWGWDTAQDVLLKAFNISNTLFNELGSHHQRLAYQGVDNENLKLQLELVRIQLGL